MEKRKKQKVMPLWLNILLTIITLPVVVVLSPLIFLYYVITSGDQSDGGFDPHIGA